MTGFEINTCKTFIAFFSPSQAIAACMATFIMDLLTANKASGKVPAILDKVQSFTKPDILLKKGTKKKKVVVSYMYMHACITVC